MYEIFIHLLNHPEQATHCRQALPCSVLAALGIEDDECLARNEDTWSDGPGATAHGERPRPVAARQARG